MGEECLTKLTPPRLSPLAELLPSVATSLEAIISLNKEFARKLDRIAKRTSSRVARARAMYAACELQKLCILEEAALKELGFGDPEGVGEGARAALGEACINMMAQLDAALDALARRVTKRALRDFVSAAEPLLVLQAAFLRAFSKVAEDCGRRAACAMLREGSDDLLALASKLKLMKAALRLRAAIRP